MIKGAIDFVLFRRKNVIRIWNFFGRTGDLIGVWIDCEEAAKMKKPLSALLKRNTENHGKKGADCFGLTVEVICRMQHYSVICYRDRELIVNTEDMHFDRMLKCAA